MKAVAALLVALAVFGAAGPAWADINQISAREIARNNNCTPTKVDIYRQTPGSEGETIYRIGCAVPKLTDSAAPKPADALLVGCSDSLCQLIRPMTADGK